ncbi:MAG: lysine--tRNA ligase [Gammaproteobacteria bacterium]|nr:MAG: lysine--tRNA ligase [Gammaproteobacteria bacterium]
MPYKLWPHKEAQRISRHHKMQDGEGPIIFETGYGPSGLPHIGTFAEVARTTFVMEAFKHQFPGREIHLIVFSDDLDGLRSLPENIPGHDMLKAHMGKPLSSIPDPYGEQSSFAGYMNNRLCHFLDHYGFTYEFISSTQTYQSGRFDEGLKRVMDHHDEIHQLFTAEIAEEKRSSWSPFFPICEQCGAIYTTHVEAIHPDQYAIDYACNQDGGGKYQPCGYVGTTSITGGRVKVGWKVDWALRWFSFGVDYEMHGKDLLHSAKLSSQICRILGGSPPLTYKYELFLDENGAKISKKIGNGIAMEQWQKYAPLGALLHFLLENPNKARRMGMPLLPRIIDDYLKALRTQDRNDPDKPLWFIDRLQHQHDADNIEANDVTFSLLVNVADNLGLHDSGLLYDYAARQGKSVTDNEMFFRELCDKAINYVSDDQLQKDSDAPSVDEKYMVYLPEFRQNLQTLVEQDNYTADAIQNAAFAVTRAHDLNQPEWFRFLYSALLRKEKGPRIGTFFQVLGPERVLEMIDRLL